MFVNFSGFVTLIRMMVVKIFAVQLAKMVEFKLIHRTFIEERIFFFQKISST